MHSEYQRIWEKLWLENGDEQFLRRGHIQSIKRHNKFSTTIRYRYDE